MRALSVIAIGGCLAAALSAQTTATGVIAGRVREATTQAPVAGATVLLVSVGQRAPGRKVQSNPAGEFTFDQVPQGRYAILVTKPGYSAASYGQRRRGDPDGFVDLAPAERRNDLVISIWKAPGLSGTVRDAAGGAVEGVTVTAHSRGIIGGRERFTVSRRAVTDKNGAYNIPELAPGQYVLSARVRPAGTRELPYPTTFFPSSTLLSGATRLDVGAGDERTDLDFTMVAAAAVRVSGIVTRPDKKPAPATVRLIAAPAYDAESDAEIMSVQTSPEGQFVFPQVPAGDYLLRVRDPVRLDGTVMSSPGVTVTTRAVGTPVRVREPPPDNTWWAELPVQVGTGHLSNLIVELQPGLRLGGRLVFDGASAPPSPEALSSLELSVYAIDDPDHVNLIPCVPASDGTFRTREIAAGRYAFALGATVPGWIPRSIEYQGQDVAGRSFTVGASTPDIVVTFNDRITTISGTVTDGRNPSVRNATILLFPSDPSLWKESGLLLPSRFRRIRSGNGGSYEVTVLPGSYSVIATSDTYPTHWQHPAYLKKISALASTVTVREGDKGAKNLLLVVLP
jgi:hypothetical protein